MSERIVERMPVDAIHVGGRHRGLNGGKVADLAGSLEAIGLMQPITVRMGEVVDGDGVVMETAILVAGRHRLAAASSIGWDEIDAFVVAYSDLESELAEIDENLMRAELSPAQVAAHLARRKELWEARKDVGGNTVPAKPQHKKQFAAETAEQTGVTKRAINKATARAAALGDDLSDVAGTSLDKGVELDALAKMDADERRPLIEQAKAGEKVTARKPVPVTSPDDALNDFEATQKQVNAMVSAWNRAGPEAREQFREYIDTPMFDRTSAGRG